MNQRVAIWAQAVVCIAMLPIVCLGDFPETVPKPQLNPIVTVSTDSEAIRTIENAIRNAQQGEVYFRRVLDRPALRRLQADLLVRTNRRVPMEQLEPMVDRAQFLLRENGGRVRLAEKVAVDGVVDRPTLHGELSELRLARQLNMVLTKSPQSEHFDLTEASFNPRSGQLKVYKDPVTGLRELQQDVGGLPKRARNGWLPEEQLQTLSEQGYLVARNLPNGPTIYRPTAGPEMTIRPASAIRNHQDSVQYAAKGREGLQQVSRSGGLVTTTVATGGMNAGFGILLLAESTNELYCIGQRGFTRANMPETGQQAALFTAGISMVVSGGAAMGTLLTTESSQLQNLSSISKWGGRVGLVLVVCSEGFVLWQYAEGHITRDDAIRSTGRLAGALAGAWAGGELGAMAGGFGGPLAPVTVPVGAFVGTIGGGLASAYAADAATEMCLTYGDEGRRTAMLEFLTEHYSH